MSLSHAIVFKWDRWFKDGRQNFDDNEWEGHEASHSNVQCNVKMAVERDRRLTIRECRKLQTLAVAQSIVSWLKY